MEEEIVCNRDRDLADGASFPFLIGIACRRRSLGPQMMKGVWKKKEKVGQAVNVSRSLPGVNHPWHYLLEPAFML